METHDLRDQCQTKAPATGGLAAACGAIEGLEDARGLFGRDAVALVAD